MDRAPRQNPSEPLGEGDARLDSAAFHRNQVPIWEVLSSWLCDRTGNVLEVGSGTGQHIVEFEPRNLDSINAWRQLAQAQNIEPPRRVDLCAPDWGLNGEDSATLSDLTA